MKSMFSDKKSSVSLFTVNNLHTCIVQFVFFAKMFIKTACRHKEQIKCSFKMSNNCKTFIDNYALDHVTIIKETNFFF